MNFEPFQRSRSSCEWLDRHRECVAEISLYFQLEMLTPESLRVPTDEKSKGPRSTHCWAVISRTKYLWKYTDMKYFNCFDVRNALLTAAEAF